MKVLIVTLVAAILATALLALAGRVYGYHSTAGIWFVFLNIPGIMVGSWVNEAIQGNGEWMEQFPGLCLCTLVNWMVYFGLAKAALWLKRKILG